MSFHGKTVGIVTLGCKVNQYESEAISEALSARGFEVCSSDAPCDAYIINTCTVTSESDRKARQTIRRMISKNPYAYILVTGCYSQISPDAVAAISGVDYICGSSNKLSVVDALCQLISQSQKNEFANINIPDLKNAQFEEMSITRFDRTRAYVKIQDGCESKCTYCTIPASRGPVRSKPFDDVIREVTGLVSGGCKEIVLTGIEIGSYGTDLQGYQDLAALLCAIDNISGIGRVRLGSLDPSVIKPDFVNRIKGLRALSPHLHLSLQSGSDRILALMKRKYNSKQAMRSIELLREAIPNANITTDIITGFPGESEEDFELSCEFIRNARFLMVHAFPYSKRQNTPAANMKDQLPESVKHERVRKINDLSASIRDSILAEKIHNDSLVTVLFESSQNGFAHGHTDDFVEVRVRSSCDLRGEFRAVRLTGYTMGICEGILEN